MKTIIQSFLLITLAIFSSKSWATDCNTPSDFLILQTQASVDSFQTDYGPCDTMAGTLLIRNSNITNLNGLSSITTVTGTLTLFNLDSLPNLTGLGNLLVIGDKFDIYDNQLLTDLSSLGVTTTGDVYITDNPNLVSLAGLENLIQINGLDGTLRIDLNPKLSTLSALSNLQTGLNTTLISRNDLLTDLTGLSGFKDSTIKLSVNNNIGLQSLNGIGTINSISTDLFIYGNTQLADVSALSGLATIGDDFDFNDTLVTDMDDFVNLNSISGTLRIKDNLNLQNIDGLLSLSGTLDILEIKDNNVLENIDGLMGITNTQSQVQIENNLALIDINGLSSLQAIDGSFNLQNNPMLSNCTPLVTLLDDNDDFTVGPGPGGAGIPDIRTNVTISDNLVNCNSIQEIFDSVAIIYVDVNTIADSSCVIGACWDHAYPNLQDALAVAISGTDIWLAQGVYYPDIGATQNGDDRDAIFTLSAGVSIYGGFNGTETNIDQRDVITNVTILSGDIDENDTNADGNFIAETVDNISGNNSYTIVNAQNGDNNTHLDGVTITASKNSDGGVNSGGGLYCGNVPSGVGINQAIFIGNKAALRGGAMYGCALNINHTRFVNNLSGIAGAIFSFGGNIKHSEFILNKADAAVGGAIRNSGAELRITNSKFMGNASNAHKAGAVWTASDIYLENSLFSGNKASSIQNKSGGALFLNGSASAQLINVTITGNRAGATGGAIGSTSSGTLTIGNSIIWNNQDATGIGTATASINHPNGTTIINNSLVQAFDPSGTSNLDADPLFSLDTDPTTAPTIVGDARLTEFSMAIDTGNNSVVATNFDLDGLQRIRNGFVDMGVYEYFKEQVFKDGFE